MKIAILLFSTTLLLLSCDNNSNSKRKVATDSLQYEIDSSFLEKEEYLKENPYYEIYDTILRGGFSISLSYDNELQYLVLKKGRATIDTIGNCSLGLPYKNLGYIGADFDSTFVFVNSYGSGNPHYIWLYEKSTGKNLLSDIGAWIDVDTLRQVLLYSKADIPSETDSMTLFDTKKMTQKVYPFPKEIFEEPNRLNRIKLLELTENTFTIEYEYQDGNITKARKYLR